MDKPRRFDARRLTRKTAESLFDLVALLRLATVHANAEGCGLITTLALADNATRWRSLPSEVRIHIEQREKVLEPQFLSKVLGRPWREGPSALLQVLAAETLGADVVGSGDE